MKLLKKANIVGVLLLTNFLAPFTLADYSGADYEVGEDGVIYSRSLDVYGDLEEDQLGERVSRRKTLTERMAIKRKKLEKKTQNRMLQKIENMRLNQERKLSRKVNRALNKVKKGRRRDTFNPNEYGRNLDYPMPSYQRPPVISEPEIVVPQDTQPAQPAAVYSESNEELASVEKMKDLKALPYVGLLNFSVDNFQYETIFSPGISLEHQLKSNFSIGLDFNRSSVEIRDESQSFPGYGMTYPTIVDYNQWSLEMYSKFFFGKGDRFRPFVSLGVGYKNFNLKYGKDSFQPSHSYPYSGFQNPEETVRGYSVFGSAQIGAEFYFNQNFGLTTAFKYSKSLSAKVDSGNSSHNSGGYVDSFGHWHPGNSFESGSYLKDAAEKIGSAGQQSVFAGVIVKF